MKVIWNPIFRVHKDLLAHGHIHSLTYHLCLPWYYKAEWSGDCHRGCMACKFEIISSGLYRNPLPTFRKRCSHLSHVSCRSAVPLGKSRIVDSSSWLRHLRGLFFILDFASDFCGILNSNRELLCYIFLNLVFNANWTCTLV